MSKIYLSPEHLEKGDDTAGDLRDLFEFVGDKNMADHLLVVQASQKSASPLDGVFKVVPFREIPDDAVFSGACAVSPIGCSSNITATFTI